MQGWLVEQATVLWNRPVATDTWRLGLSAPGIAARIRPGQFVMLRLADDRTDPLLGRPYALYDVIARAGDEPVGIEIVYLVVGKQTRLLTELRPGEPLSVWGPLGNGFDDVPLRKQLLLVAGGIGQTPFYAFAAELTGTRRYGAAGSRQSQVEDVVFCYGARSSDLLACVDDFKRLPIEVAICTDDGTAGRRALVTELAAEYLDRPGDWLVVGCGPEPMLAALQTLCRKRNVPCYLSLEVPMACGFGGCFSCAVRVRTHEGFDYRRCCVDGPVFDAASVVF